MKFISVVLITLLSACQQQVSTSFSDRVAHAEALEDTPSGAIFIGALLKEHGDTLSKFTGECYSQSTLEKDSFTLVADINRTGRFENVVVQPETTPTRCYADKIRQLRTNASIPAGFTNKSFPIVINVNYNK